MENPDLANYPEFELGNFQECILNPGEVLFIPVKYWHYVRSLNISFSVSFWWSWLLLVECKTSSCVRMRVNSKAIGGYISNWPDMGRDAETEEEIEKNKAGWDLQKVAWPVSKRWLHAGFWPLLCQKSQFLCAAAKASTLYCSSLSGATQLQCSWPHGWRFLHD